MASNSEMFEESPYVKALRARTAAESYGSRPTSRASVDQITGPVPEQSSDRRLIGSIDFGYEGEGSGIGLIDPVSDRTQIEEEVIKAHRRLERDFQPDFLQGHVIDSVAQLKRRVSQMMKPEQLYVTAFVTAVEIQNILRRIYY